MNNNMLTETDGNTTYDPVKTISYTYYADGSLYTATDRNGITVSYVYDSDKFLQLWYYVKKKYKLK